MALALVLGAPMGTVAAADGPWRFDAPLTVAGPARAGVFHHLEASGRQSVAVAAGTVAVAWEDNRDGRPRVYVALKPPGASRFEPARPVSAGEAYEPVVAAQAAGRFVLAWEEGGQVWARLADARALGPALRLSQQDAGQAALATGADGSIHAAWAERLNAHRGIRLARLTTDPGLGLRVAGAARAVTSEPAEDQQYPALAWVASTVVLAWEDRAAGHTVLRYSRSQAGPDDALTPPAVLNEQPDRRSQAFGRGTGAARPVLTAVGADRVAAVWLDKRDFEGGYDVYAAETDAGPSGFGVNSRVQDDFGNAIGQWHAAVAGNAAGQLAVVWDDTRDDSADVWLAWPAGRGWSDNTTLPGAAGPGQQHSPAIALDAGGDLHAVWVDQTRDGAPTVLRYARGHRRPTPVSTPASAR